ncbi:hypothetical protein J6590_048135 [Homalodisca vitripennis]|nr:hypothetical protein J6590_048135 [Homalodisca vitripennis]
MYYQYITPTIILSPASCCPQDCNRMPDSLKYSIVSYRMTNDLINRVNNRISTTDGRGVGGGRGAKLLLMLMKCHEVYSILVTVDSVVSDNTGYLSVPHWFTIICSITRQTFRKKISDQLMERD